MKPFLFLTALLAIGVGCHSAKKTTDLRSSQTYWNKLKTPTETAALEMKIERLFYTFCGEFDNYAQADTAKLPELSISQQVINVPMWTDRVGEYWVYSGWFVKNNYEKPLTQDIVQFLRVNQDTFKLIYYKLPQEAERNFYPFEWKKDKPFADLRPKDLIREQTNYNYAVETSPNVFRVFEGDAPCHYPLSDQREYCFYRLRLSADGINEFSQFFNKEMKLTFEYPQPHGFALKRKAKPQL